MVRAEEILGLFPDYLRNSWTRIAGQAENLQEIRLRVGRPIVLLLKNKECFLTEAGEITYDAESGLKSSQKDLENILKHLCRYSFYAYEEEMRQGFLTVPGGHRIGVAGQVVTGDRGAVRTMKHISYLNIRIAHEMIGAADGIMPFFYEKGQFLSSMIISPPGCGKTTLLRDIVRQVSNGTAYGRGQCVGVVDERSEIAGSYMGLAQNDVGLRTDVLDGCPKAAGMMMLIRSMSPKVVAVDEIGDAEDVHALLQVLRCGSSLLVTVHGSSIEEVRKKQYISELLVQKEFRRFVVLAKREGKCRIQGIYDEEYRPCSG